MTKIEQLEHDVDEWSMFLDTSDKLREVITWINAQEEAKEKEKIVMSTLEASQPQPQEKVEHDFETSNLGLGTCKKCGVHRLVPQFPPYCTPPQLSSDWWKGDLSYAFPKTISESDQRIIENNVSAMIETAVAQARKEAKEECEKMHGKFTYINAMGEEIKLNDL